MSNLKALSLAEKKTANFLFEKLKAPIKKSEDEIPFDFHVNKDEQGKILDSQFQEDTIEFEQMFKQFIKKYGIEKAKQLHQDCLNYTDAEFQKDLKELSLSDYSEMKATDNLINIIEGNGKDKLQAERVY